MAFGSQLRKLIVQDLLTHDLERFQYIFASISRCLDPAKPVLEGKGLRFSVRNTVRRIRTVQIVLGLDYYDGAVVRIFVAELCDPRLKCLEVVSIHAVIANDGSHGAPVVSAGHRSESFLPCRVPHL